jgi:hypothetical protein
MAKQLMTAAEIRDEINRRISAPTVLDGDCKDCRVPLPRQARTEDYGSNWNIDTASNCAGGCLGELDRIVRDVRTKYDCSDW